nr:uncharacterized protein LOC112016943 [Quercus suber]
MEIPPVLGFSDKDKIGTIQSHDDTLVITLRIGEYDVKRLGKSIEIYIDDMMVKSKTVSEHVGDLGNIFEVLRKYKLHLNASKCLFGMGSGKFLGYMIDANLFSECALAFQQLKDYLAQPPMMSSLEPDEVLFAYIAVAPYIISLVLIQVDRGVQRPIYYVSKSLYEAEVRYLPLKKAILVVVHGTRNLPHYFQAHIVVILTQFSLKAILRSADYIGRIVKWGTVLGAFNIKYMPRTSIKSQILTDLVAEFTEPSLEELEVYVDGTANQKGSEVGLVLVSPEKITIEKSFRLDFSATNNEVEYEALLMGMTMVRKMCGKAVEVFSDSRLVVSQVKGEFEAKNERMQGYLSQVRCLQSEFESFNSLHIPRSGNTHADSLATLMTSSAQNLPRVILVKDLYKPTEMKKEIVRVHQVRAGSS